MIVTFNGYKKVKKITDNTFQFQFIQKNEIGYFSNNNVDSQDDRIIDTDAPHHHVPLMQ